MNSIDYKGHNLVFIVGCPRSGTTWLQRLLASHPRVKTGQESDIFDEYIGPQIRHWKRDLIPETHGRSGIGLGCYFTEDQFMEILRDYLLKLLQPMIGNLKQGDFFVEKTPSHALYIPEIVQLLPECRIIHLIRDPRDVVASLLAASKSWGSSWAPKSASGACSMWIQHVRAVRDAAKVLPKERMHEVRYENMKLQPVQNIKNVSDFIGLKWDEKDLMDAIQSNDSIKGRMTSINIGGEVAKMAGTTLKEPEGFVRKAKVASWKEDLSWIEKFVTWRIARKDMAESGYYWTFPW